MLPIQVIERFDTFTRVKFRDFRVWQNLDRHKRDRHTN